MFSMLKSRKSADSKIKPKQRSAKRGHRHRNRNRNYQNAYLVIGCLSVAIFAIVLATQFGPSLAQDDGNAGEEGGDGSTQNPDAPGGNNTAPGGGGGEGGDGSVTWREGYSGHGTTHEQLGQAHWPAVEFTPYRSKANYTKAPIRSDVAMDVVFNFSQFIFDTIVTDSPALPTGYVVVKDNDTLALGPKVEENDWADLMAKYWLVFGWILFLLIIIIVIPFIAVCYCCFCCCRRCKQGCPPCDERQDFRRRLCCGICLAVLILLLLLALFIAFFSNRLLDRGLQDSSDTIRRGSEDTCHFMKDVADNIHHLMVNNYEELENHLIDQLNNAHKHLFLDLADTSESNAVTELERILDNLPEALHLMRQVDKLEKELRYTGSQLRDGVRGMKRDINYAASTLCGTDHCIRSVKNMDIEFIDTSECLHFDELPNTTVYVESLEGIIKKKHYEVPKRALQRLLEINAMVQKRMDLIIPPLIRDVKKGSDAFRDQSNKIQNIVNAVLSDIHQNTLHSTKSFDDVYERFGTGRDLVNLLVCFALFLVLVISIVSLICGCAGSAATGGGTGFCSRATGAMCLLIVILLIFCVVSFIILVGTFYFIMGLITYEGACAPLRDMEKNSLFRQFDSTIDLNMYRTPSHEDEDQVEVPAFRISNAIKACEANRTIFEILRDHHMYDINDLSRLNLLSFEDSSEHHRFDEDLSKIVILTPDERIQINTIQKEKLATYHSTLYTSSLCALFTPMSLTNLAESLKQLSYELSSEYESAVYAFYNEHLTAKAFHEAFVDELKSTHSSLVKKLNKIDELILYESFDFATSIKVLIEAIVRAEKFIQDRGKQFINSVTQNLTHTLTEQSEQYVDMVVSEVNRNVGRCDPLAYIYDRGVEFICHNMVDPINGYWVGALLGGLVMLPIILIAHRLMCLYKKIIPLPLGAAATVVEGGCPVCTGTPYVPPAIITCGGGQQAYCECEPQRGGGGGGGQTELPRPNLMAITRTTTTETTAEITDDQTTTLENQSKSKQD